MHHRFSFVFLLGLAACSTTANLYPISGPLTEENPIPTLIATVDGITGNTGNFNFTMPNGSACSGKWSSVAPQFASVTTGTLFAEYGSVAGYSTTVGNLPGVNRGQAFSTCSDNTRFDIEFFTGSGTANGYGIAKDTRGNVYKMLF
ncbi:hypothetical protein [Pseudophaeobacter flagellatus]|uniref:hypothetical protein n=1 Tax=Pseudophaeobacter flagellatus TaxID=2899119 RepID=UPI001E30A3F3|nr:hypothetical protein [Pseudophaeobacter flagellatus]MCD9146230.1 hypothetical protein [Pseudophaeobacter flagellatus]